MLLLVPRLPPLRGVGWRPRPASPTPTPHTSPQLSALPAEARAQLTQAHSQQQQQGSSGGHVRLADMPAAAVDACWRLFHAALEPVYQVPRNPLPLPPSPPWLTHTSLPALLSPTHTPTHPTTSTPRLGGWAWWSSSSI